MFDFLDAYQAVWFAIQEIYFSKFGFQFNFHCIQPVFICSHYSGASDTFGLTNLITVYIWNWNEGLTTVFEAVKNKLGYYIQQLIVNAGGPGMALFYLGFYS